MNEKNPQNVCEVSDFWTEVKETKVQADVTKNLNEVLNKLKLIPTVWSDAYETHILSRHVWGLNPWSKALPETDDQIFIDILNRVDEEYQALIDEEWNPGRRVFVVESKEPIWTNALFPKENLSQESIFLSHRDLWNERINDWKWQEILCSLVRTEGMPTTNLVHVIMWPYGPTGNAGIYTLIFGDEWMPFPRKLDESATERDVLYNDKCRDYWNSHVMLITPEELENIIKSKREHGMSTEIEESALKDFRWKDGKSPIKKDFTPNPSDWAIEINLKN